MIAGEREHEQTSEPRAYPRVEPASCRDALLLEMGEPDAVLDQQLGASPRAVNAVDCRDAHAAGRIGPVGPAAHP